MKKVKPDTKNSYTDVLLEATFQRLYNKAFFFNFECIKLNLEVSE